MYTVLLRDRTLIILIFLLRSVSEYGKLTSHSLSELITSLGVPLPLLKHPHHLFRSSREKKPNTTPKLALNASSQYEYISHIAMKLFEHLLKFPANAQIMELGESLVFGNSIS
jgi:hypothetical protein